MGDVFAMKTKTQNQSRLCGSALVAAAAVVLSIGRLAEAQSFQQPVESPIVTQPYAAYSVGSAGKFHTGMDIAKNGTSPVDSYSVPIRAARTGTVQRIFGLYRAGNNLRQYNPDTGVYTWAVAPGPAYDQPGGDNHGLGTCVILYHADLQLYSLYGHLDAVVTGLSVGQTVNAGAQIGMMGNSYKQYLRRCRVDAATCPLPAEQSAPSGIVVSDADGFNPHLHFESKDRGVVSARRTDDEGPDWGYTPGNTGPNLPGHPNWFGYHDPNLFLNETVQRLAQPLPIEVLQAPLSVRDYPSTNSTLSLVLTSIGSRTDGKLPAFVASRSVGNQWYQIYLPNAATEGWSASGWIAANVGAVEYSRPNATLSQIKVLDDSARVFQAKDAGSATLAFAYGENHADQQRFVPLDSPAGWHDVFLTERNPQQDGWILSSAAQLISGDAAATATRTPGLTATTNVAATGTATRTTAAGATATATSAVTLGTTPTRTVNVNQTATATVTGVTRTPTPTATPTTTVSLPNCVSSGCGLTVCPAPLDFGTVPLGNTADASVFVRNDSPSATVAGSVGTGDPFSITSPTSLLLGPGQSATYGVRFTPVGNGFSDQGFQVSVTSPVLCSFSTRLWGTGVTVPNGLSISLVGAGRVGNNAGIECAAGPCTFDLGSGTQLTLTAGPATGWAFSGWSGACSGTAACALSMNAPRSVTATFVPTGLTGRWTVASSPTTSSLRSVFFIDDHSGWAVGDNSIILRTFDGGATWSSQPNPGGGVGTLYDIHFADALTGWTVGSSGVFGTTNGGATWQLTLPQSGTAVAAIDSNTALIASPNGVFATTDGGQTWPLRSTQMLSTFAFANANSGWGIRSNFTDILRTIDGGQTWATATSSSSLLALALRNGAIWGVGAVPFNAILHSGDGSIWDSQASGVAETLYGVSFLDGQHGWAVGNNGAIISTTDAGAHWQVESGPTSRILFDVFYVSGGPGWAVGEKGTILKYIGPLPATATATPSVTTMLTAVSTSTASRTPASTATRTQISTVAPSAMASSTRTATTSPTGTATRTRTATAASTATITPTRTATAAPRTATRTVTSAPAVHLDPLGVPIVIGALNTLTGSGFTAGSRVLLFVNNGATQSFFGPFVPTGSTTTILAWTPPASIPLGNGFGSVMVVNTDQGFIQSESRSQYLEGAPSANIPTIRSINGVALRPLDTTVPVASVETVIAAGSLVTIGGTGFNAPLVNLFTGAGHVGPLAPQPGGTATAFQIRIPTTVATGPGTFQVVNSPYAGNVSSNAVSVVLGARLDITGITQQGSTVTVDGAGFSALSVINLWNQQGAGSVYFGGYNVQGQANVPLTVQSSTRFTFAVPSGAATGPSYLQVVNPPFIPSSTTGSDPNGSFMLTVP